MLARPARSLLDPIAGTEVKLMAGACADKDPAIPQRPDAARKMRRSFTAVPTCRLLLCIWKTKSSRSVPPHLHRVNAPPASPASVLALKVAARAGPASKRAEQTSAECCQQRMNDGTERWIFIKR